MLTLLGLVVAAMPFGMTPPMNLATDFIHYYEMNGSIVSDLNYYSENTEHCETEEAYFMFEQGTQKMNCDDVEDYFMNQYLEIGSIAYKIDGQCDSLYNTNSWGLCQLRVEWELTKLSLTK